jgi:hypothetical protein
MPELFEGGKGALYDPACGKPGCHEPGEGAWDTSVHQGFEGRHAYKRGAAVVRACQFGYQSHPYGENKLLESRNLKVGEMKIGVGDTISKYFMLPYLEIFRNRFPNINLKIINRTTTELCTLLKSGEADIAVCNFPIKDPALETRKCKDIHDIFVCGGKYRDICKEQINLEEIVRLPMILLDGSPIQALYRKVF